MIIATVYDILSRLIAGVVEWQTRRTQNPMLETTCGFKSHHQHQCASGFARGFFCFCGSKAVVFGWFGWNTRKRRSWRSQAVAACSAEGSLSDSKSDVGDNMWVQVPPPAPMCLGFCRGFFLFLWLGSGSVRVVWVEYSLALVLFLS